MPTVRSSWLLALIALGVARAQQEEQTRFWCNKFEPAANISLAQLQGNWETAYYLAFDNGLLSLPSAAASWNKDHSETIAIYNTTQNNFKLHSKSKKTGEDTFKNVVFQQAVKHSMGRFHIVNTDKQYEETDLIILAANSAKYMVWMFCQPPSSDDSLDVSSVPDKAQIANKIAVMTRHRDSMSQEDHKHIQSKVETMLESHENPVRFIADIDDQQTSLIGAIGGSHSNSVRIVAMQMCTILVATCVNALL